MGPKLVTLTPQHKYDFTGLLDLCEIIHQNSLLTALDISNNWIQPEGAMKLLAPSLKTVTTRLLHLNLTRNDLRTSGMTSLAPVLRECSGLRTLVLADNNIGDPGASALAVPLAVMTALEELNLESNSISVEGLLSLEPSLVLMTKLKSLDISGNVRHFSHESSEGSVFMARLMPSLKNLTNLTHLGLASNVLLTGGAQTLARVLGDLRKSLLSLDLGGHLGAHNRMGPPGMKMLSAGLFWTPLVVLDISFNALGYDGANSLALVLSIHTSLTEISLRGNGMGSNGVRVLIGGLVKHHRLRSLDFADNDLNSEALKYVAEALPQFSALQHLSLAHNYLVASTGHDVLNSADYDGIKLFTSIMLNSNVTTTLTSLDIKDSGLDQHGLRGMVQIIKTTTMLKHLNGLDLNPHLAEIKLPSKLDNYELLYVAQRLMDLDPPSSRFQRTDSSGKKRTERSNSSGKPSGKPALKRSESSCSNPPPPEPALVVKKRKIDVSDYDSIDLSFCGFLEFPGLLVKLRNLKELDLSGNHLMHVPIKTLMDFGSLHNLILKECPLLLHPPRCIAAKNQVVEYLRECKLREDNITLPLIVSGQNDDVIAQFLALIKPLGKGNTQLSAEEYKVNNTAREACKGKAGEVLPTEMRWCPNGTARMFSILEVKGTARLAICRPFLQVHRAVNMYAVRTSGPLERSDVLNYFDLMHEYNNRAVVALVIIHDDSAEDQDLHHRTELLLALMEQWKQKLPVNTPGLMFLEKPFCIHTGKTETCTSLGKALQLASEALIPEEGDWVHPVIAKLEDEIANIALRGHFWITWKVYFAKLIAALDEYEGTMLCVPSITEVLHAKGIIRSVGPGAGIDTFEKPMLDTVFINSSKVASLMTTMPVESKSWSQQQVRVSVCMCVCMCEIEYVSKRVCVYMDSIPTHTHTHTYTQTLSLTHTNTYKNTDI
jgi:Ran GTPase-activating protein (RanGAP) involved in mRNA processing and transport